MVKENTEKRGKMEFSKKIVIVAAFVNLAVVAFSCWMMYRTGDLSPLCYLIPSVAAETATGTMFYYNKAKVENKIKLMKQNGVPVESSDFHDTM